MSKSLPPRWVSPFVDLTRSPSQCLIHTRPGPSSSSSPAEPLSSPPHSTLPVYFFPQVSEPIELLQALTGHLLVVHLGGHTSGVACVRSTLDAPSPQENKDLRKGSRMIMDWNVSL